MTMDTESQPPSQPAATFRLIPTTSWKRFGLAGVVAASVLCGALLQKYVSSLAIFHRPPPAVANKNPAKMFGPVRLEGPGGVVTLPMDAPVLVHVWLQACADC